MKSPVHLILALVIASGGVFIGRSFAPGITGGSREKHSSATRASRSQRGTAAVPAPEKRDLRAFRRDFQKAFRDDRYGVAAEMERLSVPELKELARSLAAEMGDGTSLSPEQYGVMQAALRELYRREGVSAIEWTAGWEKGPGRKSALDEIINAAARANPESAKPWIDAYEVEYGKSPFHGIFLAALIGAKERGADDVIKFYELFGGDASRGVSTKQGEYADDFDFGKLFTALAGKRDISDALHHWAVRDKDAAWSSVKANLGEMGTRSGNAFRALVSGAITAEGEDQGLRWACARLQELPDEQRAPFLESIDNHRILTTEGVSSVMDSLSGADRRVFAASLIGQAQGTEKTFAALDALSRQDLIEALGTGARRDPEVAAGAHSGKYTSGIQNFLGKAEARYHLTPEERARILRKDL